MLITIIVDLFLQLYLFTLFNPNSQTCKSKFYPVSTADSVSSLLAEIQQILLVEYDRLMAETE